jgi:hypothetical protein
VYVFQEDSKRLAISLEEPPDRRYTDGFVRLLRLLEASCTSFGFVRSVDIHIRGIWEADIVLRDLLL